MYTVCPLMLGFKFTWENLARAKPQVREWSMFSGEHTFAPALSCVEPKTPATELARRPMEVGGAVTPPLTSKSVSLAAWAPTIR